MTEQTVNANPEGGQEAPALGTPEYDAAMAQKYRDSQDPSKVADNPVDPAVVKAMPEGGHEKFWDADKGVYNWQAHATELQFKMDQKAAKEADKDPTETAEASDEQTAEEQAVSNIVEKAGLSEEALMREISTNGKLSDEAIASLEKVGIPKSLIETHVTAVKAQLDGIKNDMVAFMGGEAAYNEMVNWGNENLDDGTLDSVNTLFAKGNWKQAMTLIQGAYKASAPGARQGKLENGLTSLGGSTVAYESKAQQSADINSPKYRTDPAFRAHVAQRIAATKRAGGYRH